ncbi:hypothetical protein EJB05_32822, partial [Eragrostis curvula]
MVFSSHISEFVSVSNQFIIPYTGSIVSVFVSLLCSGCFTAATLQLRLQCMERNGRRHMQGNTKGVLWIRVPFGTDIGSVSELELESEYSSSLQH